MAEEEEEEALLPNRPRRGVAEVVVIVMVVVVAGAVEAVVIIAVAAAAAAAAAAAFSLSYSLFPLLRHRRRLKNLKTLLLLSPKRLPRHPPPLQRVQEVINTWNLMAAAVAVAVAANRPFPRPPLVIPRRRPLQAAKPTCKKNTSGAILSMKMISGI